jgi:hypothetical protein
VSARTAQRRAAAGRTRMDGRRPPPLSTALVAAFLAALLAALPVVRAQGAGASVGGSVEFDYGASVGWSSLPPAVGTAASLLTGVHADMTARLPPVTFTLRLDPSLSAPAGATVPILEPGLSEAYALLREGPIDVSAGLRRLTLETARLTVPFQVDPVAADGTRRGLLSARVAAYTGLVRVRAAALLDQGRLGGALSVRLDLTSAQLEAHALYLEAPVFGVSASGTVSQTVVYGEAWLLAAPWRGRGALGVSGYLGSALWTLEAAFAPPPGAPTAVPLPQLAAQLDVPLADGDTLHGLADVGLTASQLVPGSRALQASASLTWEAGGPDLTLELGPNLSAGELGASVALLVRLRATTGF